MGLCCSLARAQQPSGNLSGQISTCGKVGSLNSRFINNGCFIKARPVAAVAVQMADFILSRTSSLSARPRHFYHTGMADFISPRIRSLSAAKPSYFLARARFTKAGQLQWPFCQQCGRNRLISKKRPNGQISAFGLCVADFILSRIRNLSAARPSHFIKGSQNELQFYQRQPQRFIKASGRFIKPMAVLSNRPKPNGHFIKTDQA